MTRVRSLSFQASCSIVSSNDPGAALDPLANLVSDAKAAAAGHDERQVADQPRVHQSVVRRYVRAGLEQREEDGRRAVRRQRQRRVAQRVQRLRAALRISRHRVAVLPEIKGAPGRVVEHALLVVARPVCIARSRRARTPPGSCMTASSSSRIAVGRGLDFRQPGKAAVRIELDLRQPGKVVVARLLDEDPLLAERDVERLREPRARRARIEATAGELLAQIRLVLRRVAGARRPGRDAGPRRGRPGAAPASGRPAPPRDRTPTPSARRPPPRTGPRAGSARGRCAGPSRRSLRRRGP